MRLIVAAALLAGAVTVSAQVSALPTCALVCGLDAAEATSCDNPEDEECTCQLTNQAIIAPLLEACLATACTNTADITAAISAGEAICATISQTAVATSTSILITTSAAPASTSPSAVVITQISDGQIQATTSTSKASTTSSAAITSVTPYTGAAAAGNSDLVTGMQALLAAAGIAIFAI